MGRFGILGAQRLGVAMPDLRRIAKEEFVKRAAFALIACLAWHDKAADDERFIELLPLLRRAATDQRNLVKKAVSWALRTIGKRNARLNQVAMQAAREIQQLDSRAG